VSKVKSEAAQIEEHERLGRVQRLGLMKRRLVEVMRQGGFHDASAGMVDLDMLERAVGAVEQIVAFSPVYITVGRKPPVAVKGRGRGFALKDDGEGEE
jgi:hypothetical protein